MRAAGGRWSLKRPTTDTGLTAIGRIKCQTGASKWIIHMSWNLPRFSRGPSGRVPICHKCAQERIVRRCFAQVALLRQFPPRPSSTLLSVLCILLLCVLCAVCCVLCVPEPGNGVAPCAGGGAVLRRRALLPPPIDSHSSRPLRFAELWMAQ